jgi:8-oxo-dGTP pyrophosphatase MutT (NUDIX family)
MTEFLHRIRVFVYSYKHGSPDYLLLKREGGRESFWTPLNGSLGFGEQLESAVRREVVEEVGLAAPSQLIDLNMPSSFELGDEQVVEWNFACRAPLEGVEPKLASHWAAFQWAQFDEAYPALEFEQDRRAIVRLHTLLHAA